MVDDSDEVQAGSDELEVPEENSEESGSMPSRGLGAHSGTSLVGGREEAARNWLAGEADMLDFGALSLASEATWNRQERRPEESLRSFLTFLLADAVYGLDLVRLREIMKTRAPTEVPRTPPFIAGIISVRGMVIPVLDLRVRLSLPARNRDALRCLVVARGEDRFGLLVDQVLQVVTLAPSEIEANPTLARPIDDTEGARRRAMRSDEGMGSGDPSSTEFTVVGEASRAEEDADFARKGPRGIEFVAGIGRAANTPEQFIILLDLDAVLRFEIRRRRRGESV
jgi:chemotaxis signal transduction protein